MSMSSATSLLEATKVESLPSVDGNENYNLDEPLKSLEDISKEIVKTTLVKVLSGEVNFNDVNSTSVRSKSLIDSPSRIGLLQSSEKVENSETLIDTPSKLNLTQINECYENGCNENNEENEQSATNNHVNPSENPDNKTPKPNSENVKCLTENNDNAEQKEGKTEDQEAPPIEKNPVNNPDPKPQSAKGLYSTSSTHLCTKLSETLQITDNAHSRSVLHQSIRSLDLSNHDIRTSVSLIDSMSGSLEQAVDKTLDSNFKKLEERFDSDHDIETHFTAVQDMGQTMLADDVKTSKAESNNISLDNLSHDRDLTVEDLDERRDLSHTSRKMSELEITISRLKIEVESYRAELEKIRPDANDIVLKCNELDIDPAIATVPHLLDLLQTARTQNSILQEEVGDITTKLINTTNLLDEQKHIYQELKKKLKSIDVEDERRREKNLIEMDNYYKNKLNEIETELKERGIHIGADFWTPHLTNMREFLSQIHMHKDEVAEEELQRDISNAGTDKFSDDEPMVFPVEGYRESFCETDKAKHEQKLFEDDDATGSAEGPRQSKDRVKNASSKSKTCSIQ